MKFREKGRYMKAVGARGGHRRVLSKKEMFLLPLYEVYCDKEGKGNSGNWRLQRMSRGHGYDW
jgi:hypothetical protein